MMNNILPTPFTFLKRLKNKHQIRKITIGMSLLFFALTLSAQKGIHNADATTDKKDLSGTWYTEAPVPYLVEYTPEHPQGKSISHSDIQLLERSATLKWTLTQRPDGLIVGTNDWIVYDEKGNKVFEGSEPLLGVYSSERTVLCEPEDKNAKTAQIIFEIKLVSQEKIQGIAYSVGGPKLMVMNFVLVRKPYNTVN